MIWNKLLVIVLFLNSHLNAKEIIVSPAVEFVIRSQEVLAPSREFFRAILLKSEMDACIYVDKINVQKNKTPKIIETLKYCKFDFNGITLSLLQDKHRESEVKNIKWEKNILEFELNYTGKEISTSRLFFTCSIDPIKFKNEFFCKLSL